MNETTTKSTIKTAPSVAETAMKIFAVFGIVIVILVALYGAFAVLRSVPNVWNSLGNAFSSVTSKFDEENVKRVSVSSNKSSVASGEEFSLYLGLPAEQKQGSYSFAYDCIDGVNMEFVSPIDNGRQFAFCNTETSFVNQNNSLRLVPTLVNKEVASVPIYVYFKESGSDKVSAGGQINMTITRAADTTTNTNTSSNSNTNNNNSGNSGNTGNTGGPYYYPYYGYGGGYYGQPTYPTYTTIPNTYTNYNLYGRPDLAVRVLETGIVDRSTNQFIATTYISKNDRVAVKFEVENKGTNVSGIWSYNVSLPTVPFYIYPGTNQISLNPGDRIQYVIAFDSIQARQDNQVVINIDQNNAVAESNEANNLVIQNIRLSVY